MAESRVIRELPSPHKVELWGRQDGWSVEDHISMLEMRGYRRPTGFKRNGVQLDPKAILVDGEMLEPVYD